jgi:hypothetical protein
MSNGIEDETTSSRPMISRYLVMCRPGEELEVVGARFWRELGVGVVMTSPTRSRATADTPARFQSEFASS